MRDTGGNIFPQFGSYLRSSWRDFHWNFITEHIFGPGRANKSRNSSRSRPGWSGLQIRIRVTLAQVCGSDIFTCNDNTIHKLLDELLTDYFYRAALNAGGLVTLVTIMLSVCPSVRRSNAWFATKRKKAMPSFLYSAWKTIHPSFVTRTMNDGGWPLLPEILGQTDPVGAKTPIFVRYSLDFHTMILDNIDMHFVCRDNNAMWLIVLYDNSARMLTGLFCIIPCTDSIVKVDLRLVSFDVPPQEVSFVVISVFISVRRTFNSAHENAARPRWHHPGDYTQKKSNFFCGWIYKEYWTNDHLEGGGWEWWRWLNSTI